MTHQTVHRIPSWRLEAAALSIAVAVLAALAAAQPAAAQARAAPAAARAAYERQIARCNDDNLPRPQREACIRQAGAALDRVRGGPAPDVAQESPDGRALIVGTPGAVPDNGATGLVSTPNGRAVVVEPKAPTVPAVKELK